MEQFFIHTIPPNQSSKMHTVLDLHHMENSTPNPDEIAYEVFVVEREKQAKLYVISSIIRSMLKQLVSIFRKLGNEACKQASARCRDLYWGTDRL